MDGITNMNLVDSDRLFLALLTNDMVTVLHVIGKVIGGLFMSPDAIAIYVVFALGSLAFWLKSKIES